MADHSITINSQMSITGIGPNLVLWGSMVWGNDPWAHTDEELATAHKVVANSQSSSDTWFQYFHKVYGDSIGSAFAMHKRIYHTYSQSCTMTDDYPKFVNKAPFSSSITPSSDMTSMTVMDLVGYKYVYPDNTTNADDQVITSYTAGSTPEASFTSSVPPTTEWS